MVTLLKIPGPMDCITEHKTTASYVCLNNGHGLKSLFSEYSYLLTIITVASGKELVSLEIKTET
jgi:hypothetical protein